MDAIALTGLAGLGYLERELAQPMERAAVLLPDDDLKSSVRAFGEEHAHHAQEIDRILHSLHAETTHVPDDFKVTAHSLADAVAHATDLTSLMVALVQAERHIVDLYDAPLEEDIPGAAATALERQRREDQHHVDFLEDRGAIAVPELADIGDADGTGGAEDV